MNSVVRHIAIAREVSSTDFRGAILQGIKLSLDGAVEAIFDETRYDVAAAG